MQKQMTIKPFLSVVPLFFVAILLSVAYGNEPRYGGSVVVAVTAVRRRQNLHFLSRAKRRISRWRAGHVGGCEIHF
ncbi:MAG: hypothetical protein LC778_02360 [Acidobacteria bacterium]|nr:hypothetical protein [Acidobacteriota bacterium]